jgi:N-acetylneuraminic acid mutarotase
MGLCFFNNGSTLYAFGGLLKNGAHSYQPSSTIESLSKGQNNWKILNVKLPQPTFDIGSIDVSSQGS